MRKILLTISLTIALSQSYASVCFTEVYKIEVEKPHSQFMHNIQGKIQKAFEQSMLSKSNTPLLKLRRALDQEAKSNPQKWISYWQGYVQYYLAVYYQQQDDEEQAENASDKGVSLLEKEKNKNSEHYALLAMLQGFSMQFKGMRAMFIAGDMKENQQKAFDLNSNNIRAYYVYAHNDFLRPETFGGGKEVDKYLLKVIAFPKRTITNTTEPYWGRAEAYQLLIRFYTRQGKTDKAKQYYSKAKELYPNRFFIKID